MGRSQCNALQSFLRCRFGQSTIPSGPERQTSKHSNHSVLPFPPCQPSKRQQPHFHCFYASEKPDTVTSSTSLVQTRESSKNESLCSPPSRAQSRRHCSQTKTFLLQFQLCSSKRPTPTVIHKNINVPHISLHFMCNFTILK